MNKNDLKWNKGILFPNRLRELWPQIKSQAALDNKEIGEWILEAIEYKLSSKNIGGKN
jgi:hypothetical protein